MPTFRDRATTDKVRNITMRKRNRPSPASPVSLHGYPRPMLQREAWQSLDGPWHFAIDANGTHRAPKNVNWTDQIVVPFAPETKLSGVEADGYFQSCWYRRSIALSAPAEDQRVIIHFGAVDWSATVWVNGQLAMRHDGGYTPFSGDITDWLIDGEEQEIIVRADDDPHEMAKPRGKQDWEPKPHSIWYQRTSGIWQSVWFEIVNASHVSHLQWTPDFTHFSIRLDATIAGARRDDLRLALSMTCDGRLLADDVYSVTAAEVHRSISLSDPGIGDARDHMTWRPGRPNLIDVKLRLIDSNGNELDRVASYTALRGVDVVADRFILNGSSTYLRLALDQGYWPDSGLTAPDDDALRRDVELALAMGFNGVRKHQKIEQPRFLYWADKLGLMVWEELPSAYTYCENSIQRLTNTWTEAIHRDVSHPCIVAWVPINESWGVPNLLASQAQRDFLQALTSLTKSIDPTRPVIGNDGWEQGQTDLITIHDYDADPQRLAARYTVDNLEYLFNHVQLANVRLLLQQHPYAGQPILLSEFGGIAFSRDTAGTWGYSRVASSDDLAARYGRLLTTIRSLPLLKGFCYTQFTDTFQEANGLLYMDRTPKFPIEEIAVATRGAMNDAERAIEAKWSESTEL